MKPREYCCCAIPLVNAGVYAALTEQLVLGIVAGALAFGTPSIVGASTPSFAAIVFGIVCFVGAAVQFLGIFGVLQEKPQLFRRYVQLHFLVTIAAFAVAAAWTVISATRHGSASSKCEKDFFADDDGSTTDISDAGQKMCDIFPWVDVGIMGALIAVIGIMQIYLYFVVLSYSRMQREDHRSFDSSGATTGIPMQDRSGDGWNSRPSIDALTLNAAPTGTSVNRGRSTRETPYGHLRQESDASVASMLTEKPMEPARYDYNNAGYPAHPSHAYTQDPEPTPYSNNNYYSSGTGSVSPPQNTQAHPAEGSFGRKTPRRGSADRYGDY